LLEGERRSFENVKLDLMRRIKMLEYALRMERCVVSAYYLSVVVTKHAQVQTTLRTRLTYRASYKTFDYPSERCVIVSKR
jgi:hypothetical protein